MRYLVHFRPKDYPQHTNDGKFHYSLPYEFKPAQERELLDKLDELEGSGYEYRIEVCYAIDRKDIIPPSE